MESSLKLCGTIKLLEKLNSASDKKLKISFLVESLGYSEAKIVELSKNINLLDKLIDIKGDSLYLKHSIDLLSAHEIYCLRRSRGRVEVAETLTSTNTVMAKNLDNLVSGDVLAAEIQTAGRGRRGDKWYSTLGKQLTFSVSMFFDKESQISLLSVLTGTAVCLGLEGIGVKGLMLKWPNDLYFENKKVGGILIENHFLPHKVASVIGIGINVYKDNFGLLSRDYTALFDLPVKPGLRNLLMAKILDNLYALYEDLEKESNDYWLGAFVNRDFLKGKNISAIDGKHNIFGIADGISPNGELRILSGGQVTLCKAAHITMTGDTLDITNPNYDR